MSRASFHVSVTDSSVQDVLYQETFYQDTLSVGQSAKSDVRVKGLPDLNLELFENGNLLLVSGKHSKNLSKNTRLSFPQGWTLAIELNKEQGSAKLNFFKQDPSSEQAGQKRVSKRLLLPLLFLILSIALITSPWWLVNFSQQKEQMVVEKLLEHTLSPGPLHAAHTQATAQCSDCHQQSFEPISIEPCLSCHTMKRHLTREQTGVHPLCVTCHKEHESPSILVHRDSRLCTQCHENHSTLDAVLAEGIEVELDLISGFPETHPEFEPKLQSESMIRFSHALHMNEEKVGHVNSNEALACNDCHRPDKTESGFEAVKMVESCGTCHRLEYKTENGRNKKIHHGDLLWIADLSSSMNGFSELNSVLNAQCGQCHTLPKQGFESIEAIQSWGNEQSLVKTSFNKVRFSHARHQTNFKCVDCHEGANSSGASKDNLLPEKKACGSCHTSHPENPKELKTDCADCHVFHTVPWD